MNPIRWLIGKLKGEAALDVGLAEIGNGLRYPVTAYDEEVSPMLVRGSRPDGREAELWTKYGIRGSVNLCAEPCADNWPANGNVAVLHIPVIDNTPPLVQQVHQFLEFVNTRAKPYAPVYVHCEAGKGRTGVFVACYRISMQGWTAERAAQDAIQHGLALDSQIAFIREWKP